VIRFLPALTITDALLKEGCNLFEQALDEVASGKSQAANTPAANSPTGNSATGPAAAGGTTPPQTNTSARAPTTG
jgi:hypothetical protein